MCSGCVQEIKFLDMLKDCAMEVLLQKTDLIISSTRCIEWMWVCHTPGPSSWWGDIPTKDPKEAEKTWMVASSLKDTLWGERRLVTPGPMPRTWRAWGLSQTCPEVCLRVGALSCHLHALGRTFSLLGEHPRGTHLCDITWGRNIKGGGRPVQEGMV